MSDHAGMAVGSGGEQGARAPNAAEPLPSALLAAPATAHAFTATARIIARQLAPPELLRDIVRPEDVDDAMEVLRLTAIDPNRAVGNLSLVPAQDRPIGPGAGLALMAFTHPARASRFTDGTRGVWYAGLDIETAIAETVFDDLRLLRAFGEPAQRRPKQVLYADLLGGMTDLRVLQQAAADTYRRLHDPDPAAYAFAQAYGAARHAVGDEGIVYDSVRRTDPVQGTCVAVLRPRAIRAVTRGSTIAYDWDGHALTVGPVRPVG